MTAHALRYDINLSILFTELPLLERPAAAAEAGFTAVEFWWPFDRAVPDGSDVDRFVAAVEDAGVQLVGLNFFAGDMAGGDRGRRARRPPGRRRLSSRVSAAIKARSVQFVRGRTARAAEHGELVARRTRISISSAVSDRAQHQPGHKLPGLRRRRCSRSTA